MPTILVCDDEDVLRALIRATLGSHGRVVEARNGLEALELVHATRPDVVILDVMMPGRTGLEVLAEIRSDPDVAGTPVLMLTARTQADDIDAAAAADRYLPKPFSPARLLEVVSELLREAA